MKQAIAQTAGHIHEYRANITVMILAACFLTMVFYAMNLYALISRTVAIEHAEGKASAIASTLNTLDAQYLRLSSTITPDALSRYGLEPAQVSLYITKPASTASLGEMALRGHEL